MNIDPALQYRSHEDFAVEWMRDTTFDAVILDPTLRRRTGLFLDAIRSADVPSPTRMRLTLDGEVIAEWKRGEFHVAADVDSDVEDGDILGLFATEDDYEGDWIVVPLSDAVQALTEFWWRWYAKHKEAKP
jgi:hypothetical protein